MRCRAYFPVVAASPVLGIGAGAIEEPDPSGQAALPLPAAVPPELLHDVSLITPPLDLAVVFGSTVFVVRGGAASVEPFAPRLTDWALDAPAERTSTAAAAATRRRVISTPSFQAASMKDEVADDENGNGNAEEP